jgi:predicted GNAT superfamily acetyltransferase
MIERGLPSDRFVARWQIGSAHVVRRLSAPSMRPADLSLPRVNETRRDHEGFMVNRRLNLSFTAPRMLLEIPANTDEMRVRALKLAQQWRLETRRIFKQAFDSGCRVVDFVTTGDREGRQVFYVLSGGRRA